MNIGIDIDDTIANTYDVLFKYLQEYTKDDIIEDRDRTNKDALAQMYHTKLSSEENRQGKDFFDKYYEKAVINVEPKEQAVEMVNILKEEGNQIYFITARFSSEKFDVEKLTKEWLAKYNIQYDKLILNSQNKLLAATENHIDIFIDDNIKHCTAMTNAGIKTYIMDTVINKDFEDKQIERVYSWAQLYQEIKSYKEAMK